MSMSISPEPNIIDQPLTLSAIFPIEIVFPGVIVLSSLFLIVLFFYFRVKNQSDHFSSSRSALNPTVLASLPITVFSSGDSECVVCLSDLAAGELGRRLPRCGHGFHLGCIDEWFRVDSTCPVCRSSVDPPASFSGGKKGMNEFGGKGGSFAEV